MIFVLYQKYSQKNRVSVAFFDYSDQSKTIFRDYNSLEEMDDLFAFLSSFKKPIFTFEASTLLALFTPLSFSIFTVLAFASFLMSKYFKNDFQQIFKMVLDA